MALGSCLDVCFEAAPRVDYFREVFGIWKDGGIERVKTEEALPQVIEGRKCYGHPGSVTTRSRRLSSRDRDDTLLALGQWSLISVNCRWALPEL